MSYIGDFLLGSTVDGLSFTTRRFTTGVPFTLAGSPALAAYPNSSASQITAGITLDVDFDGLVGYHAVQVEATTGNGYAIGTDYSIVVTAGTVDGVSIVGEKIGSFSIENRSVSAPLAIVLDIVSQIFDKATNLPVDPADQSLLAADIAAVKADTAAVKAKTDNLPAAPASTTNITAGTITTVTNLTNAPTVGDFTAVMKTSIGTAVAASAVASVTGAVGSVTGMTASDVGAIKVQTDKFVFTVANQVNANVKSVNDITVTGDGQAGTEWGP